MDKMMKRQGLWEVSVIGWICEDKAMDLQTTVEFLHLVTDFHLGNTNAVHFIFSSSQTKLFRSRKQL